MTAIADVTPFEVWSQIVVPSLLGGAALVVAIASLVISVASHRWSRALTAAQLEDREDEQRAQITDALGEWKGIRAQALELGLDHDDYESTAIVADLALAVVIRIVERSQLPAAGELLLLLQLIDKDTERAAADRSNGLLSRYNVALEIAPMLWRADPSMFVQQIKLLDGILRPEGMTPPSEEISQVMEMLLRRWTGTE